MKNIKYIMYLFLGIFLIGLLGGTAHAIEEKFLEAKFIGNEAFLITDGDFTLLTDFPYQSGAYGYMEYEVDFPAITGNVLSLITHRHLDHFDPLLFSVQSWEIIGPREVTVPLAQNKVIKLENTMLVGPLDITLRKTSHANVDHLSYLVTWAGRKMLFVGDTEDLGVLKDLPDLNALFITPWLHRKAMMNKALPKTKKIIIYHHKAKDIIPDCSGCIIPTQNQIIDIN
ncbi:MAG: hypothetical protein COB54_09185 [Alphaproteobacteria bacterium]|nr:MAG: hypothetical protein COB54_09185 [Alphaproteobacteria bacterium]